MKIRKAEVIVASPDRNFVTLSIEIDDGLQGLGDATLNGRELAVAAYLEEHVIPFLIDQEAHRIEHIWQLLYRGAYWRRGPVTMTAIAAVDVALWDIKAKAAGMPLYQLLGGQSRTGLLAYGHATGRDIPELEDSIRNHLSAGYRAIRVQASIPGARGNYGVPSGDVGPDSHRATTPQFGYEPARRGEHVVEGDWDSRTYLRYIPSVFEAVRNEFGPELPLLHDVHHRLTPIQAARLGKALEPYDLFWLEDCTPAENQESLRLVRQHTTTPLAIGEVFNSIWDYQSIVQEQLVDYIRSSVSHSGGITHLKRILEYAAQYQIKSGMHGPTDISPVGMAAAMHLGLAIHNFGIQEYMQHSAATLEMFRTSYSFKDGLLHPGDQPGIGVTLERSIAAKYPYERAYLPTSRLTDGTVHDW